VEVLEALVLDEQVAGHVEGRLVALSRISLFFISHDIGPSAKTIQKTSFLNIITAMMGVCSSSLYKFSQKRWGTTTDGIYSVSQKKVAPPKLFAIFSLRLSVFP